ncbi:MAG: ribonuclease HI family protein [Patescibacteria group bacterium]
MIIYCDGGSRGNPGPAASAFVVTQYGVVVYKEGKYLGLETNNVAEYTAVLLAITWLTKQAKITNSKSQITINLDSQLVERQLNGKYKIKNEKLKKLSDEIKLKIVNCKSVTGDTLKIIFKWGYREKNTLADQLVNETLDKVML